MIKKAYAKINLGLKVIGKRDDGYHNLEMLTTKVSLSDKLFIRKNKDIHVICNGVCEKDNLVYKIARYLKEEYNVDSGAKITIKKKIPMMAGLGGGSSDAGESIKALNKVWSLNLKSEEMIDVGLRFGSDIPFFIGGTSAFVSGRGENIKEIKSKKKLVLLLVKPSFGFQTKDVFNNVKEFSNKNELEELIKNYENGNLENLSKNLVNDLEKAIDFNYSKLINNIKNDLKAYGALNALMSGSGSCVFGVFRNNKERNKAYNSLKMFYDVYRIKTIK